ncbi:hypothetical protein [Pseudomonas sp. KCJK9016]|uniref:hypothetical protein n=1 Tax=Pseudomonas sp. KCJK9016 TaxID=3344556 RepID=UPI003905C91A
MSALGGYPPLKGGASFSRLEQRHSPGPAAPVSDEEYVRELTELAYRRQGPGRSLTVTAMRRHGLLPMPT